VFAFHDTVEIGPRMLARIARQTGLTPAIYSGDHPLASTFTRHRTDPFRRKIAAPIGRTRLIVGIA
jgi:hypothetical protein